LLMLLGVMAALAVLTPPSSRAGFFTSWFHRSCENPGCSAGAGPECVVGHQWTGAPGGSWYWLRSPEQEHQAIMGLYARYCIRCHGVNGRGVWDIPGVPDFTNPRFHMCRSDGQLVRAILEGRGAVMPPFRGTLTLEEGWGMARYLRTFIPGTEFGTCRNCSPCLAGNSRLLLGGPQTGRGQTANRDTTLVTSLA
jgi:hypothetical protein